MRHCLTCSTCARFSRPVAWCSAALERETIARNDVEERFKQAFMRGVCALNFEALSVMRGEHKTGGSGAGASTRMSPMPVRL